MTPPFAVHGQRAAKGRLSVPTFCLLLPTWNDLAYLKLFVASLG
jgi:hypothetical protein